jgi:hypothetical protein
VNPRLKAHMQDSCRKHVQGKHPYKQHQAPATELMSPGVGLHRRRGRHAPVGLVSAQGLHVAD